MSKMICIHNATLLTGFSVMKNCAVLVKDNVIEDVFSEERFLKKTFESDVQFIDAAGAYVAPGLIDTHIHGFKGHGTDEISEESILLMSEDLAQYGVTSFIPTMYPSSEENMINGIKTIEIGRAHV